MSSAKDIRGKISSIKSTQKITKAMEMVAASKMRKVQLRMQSSRPYAEHIRAVIGHLARSQSEYQHPFLIERPIKRVGYIIVSTDRGLCGGLNINVFRTAIAEMKQHQQQQHGIDLCLLGSKAEAYFTRLGSNIVAKVSHLGDQPNVMDLVGSIKVMLDKYIAEELDALYIVTNRFINTMMQKPVVERLLPLVPIENEDTSHYWDYIYEPDAEVLIERLLTRYIESQIYQAVIENIACEQAARMVAMKSASDNASTLIDELQLIYNKARQASITQELAEIVAGAAAV